MSQPPEQPGELETLDDPGPPGDAVPEDTVPDDAGRPEGEVPYLAAMERLSDARVGHGREVRRIHQRYAAEVESVMATVHEIGADLIAATGRLRAAHTLVMQVDEDCEGLWHAVLWQLPGRHAGRAEALPAAAPRTLALPGPRAPGSGTPALPPAPGGSNGNGRAAGNGADPATTAWITARLDEVEEMLAEVRERRPVSGAGYLALAVMGAVGGTVGFGLARGLGYLADLVSPAVGVVLFSLSRIVPFVAPFLGLAGLHWYLARRAARLTPTTVLVVVAGGVLAICLAGVVMRGWTG